jgi:putative tricarboxylic transport membrane protein
VWVLTVLMLLLPVVRIWRKRAAMRRAAADV